MSFSGEGGKRSTAMSIEFRILGDPGLDNALWVLVNSGQSITRILFDCGEGCLSGLPVSEVQAFDHLFFSHLHMDHVAGFDSLFRCTFDRDSRPNTVWGPPGTARILQNRFRGFVWNLHEGLRGSWSVNDIHPDRIERASFKLSEAFEVFHDEGSSPRKGPILDHQDFNLEALAMDHGTPSLAFLLREKPRLNIDKEKLAKLGLPPGPWLNRVKDSSSEEDALDIEGRLLSLSDLREKLLVESPGDSLAYLTDFILDGPALERLSVFLRGCGTIVCEAQYRHEDLELARRNYHLTGRQAGEIAARAGAERLVVFHISERYQPDERQALLEEARSVFPPGEYPEHWAAC